jgi:hypothetical protein
MRPSERALSARKITPHCSMAPDSKFKSVISSTPFSTRPAMFELHPRRETISSINETDDRVGGSSPAGGAETESNRSLYGERCGEPYSYTLREREQSTCPSNTSRGATRRLGAKRKSGHSPLIVGKVRLSMLAKVLIECSPETGSWQSTSLQQLVARSQSQAAGPPK